MVMEEEFRCGNRPGYLDVEWKKRTNNEDSWLDFTLFLPGEETRDAVRNVGMRRENTLILSSV